MGGNERSIEESRLKFTFCENTHVVKFDDTVFYRNKFNKFPDSKGIDILADSNETIQLIEIKNCTDYENENIWRTSINNTKRNAAPPDLDMESRNSLDIEVVKKVVSTIVCLYGSWSKSERTESAFELVDFWKGLTDSKVPRDKKKILVILFLEGDFDSNGPKSRSKKMIMKRIQDSIYKKLSWLNCQVSVVDSLTYRQQYFMVSSPEN